MKIRRLVLLAGGTLALLFMAGVLTASSLRAPERVSDQEVEAADPSAPVFLSDLHWEQASTGWVALADDNLPKLDNSFVNSPISIGGKGYEKGIGTFPLSEITYDLGGRYRLFKAEVGVDDAVPAGRGSVVFKLFLDDAIAFDSGVVTAGTQARGVELQVTGVDRMKLVVEDAGDGATYDYADWGGATLLPDEQPSLRLPSLLKAGLDAQRSRRKQGREQDWIAVMQRSEQELAAVSASFHGALPAREAAAVFDSERRQLVLANSSVAVTLGYGGERNGLLNVSDLQARTLVMLDTTPSVTVADLGSISLSGGTEPLGDEGYLIRRVDDPVLGSGLQVRAAFALPQGAGVISPVVTLYDGSSFLTYQLELSRMPPDVPVHRVSYFTPDETGRLLVGEEAGYITDYSLTRRAAVRDDSVLRKELVGLGKPLLLYDRARSQGVVMAIVDETADPGLFTIRLNEGKVSAQVGFEMAVPDEARAKRLRLSPRLFVQATRSSSPEAATSEFRKAMAGLYPPPQIPSWVKYQWGTWYAFGMGYDEASVKAQIDYIAQNLADLGPWNVLLDAGWYVAEGKPDSSWENVDEAKFPNGLRSLVDYAHSKGIRVVLYFSAPYLDDREREGNWLGLRGFIEAHPEWVTALESDTGGASYVYDFTNPGLVEYMRGLIGDFFRLYDVDGIKIDGLGQAEGEQLQQQERDTFGDVNKIRVSTMDIYRLVWQEANRAKPDVYVESGWAVPNYANQFAHTFRYGDEFPSVENRYPAPGLLEHIDYAAMQKRVIGQRPNMGMIWGGPESQQMIRLWFEAALAMGTQMTISTDLTRLSPRDLSALRAVLTHYNAFRGDARFVGMPVPGSFATTTGGITYLGAVSRQEEPRSVSLKLTDYGLDDQTEYLLYDVSSGAYSRVRGSFQTVLSGIGFRLFLLRATPGVVWTSSSTDVEANSTSLKVTVRGPRSVGGFLQLYAPRLSAVKLDGKPLPRSTSLEVGENYSYDSARGVLRLRYRHDQAHTIEVGY